MDRHCRPPLERCVEIFGCSVEAFNCYFLLAEKNSPTLVFFVPSVAIQAAFRSSSAFSPFLTRSNTLSPSCGSSHDAQVIKINCSDFSINFLSPKMLGRNFAGEIKDRSSTFSTFTIFYFEPRYFPLFTGARTTVVFLGIVLVTDDQPNYFQVFDLMQAS